MTTFWEDVLEAVGGRVQPIRVALEATTNARAGRSLMMRTADGDGFPDACDRCGDLDHDADVDLTDLVGLTACRSGSGVLPTPATPLGWWDCVEVFDAESDFDVDLVDLAEFQSSFDPVGGPNRRTDHFIAVRQLDLPVRANAARSRKPTSPIQLLSLPRVIVSLSGPPRSTLSTNRAPNKDSEPPGSE